MLQCHKCSVENKKDAKFCSECGTSFIFDDVPREFKPLIQGSLISDTYEILNKIKSGGMGSVYKARKLDSHEIYAVKELINFSMEEAKQQEAIKRFKREANILSELRHPNLPSVIDYFSMGGRYYLVMDFIEGQDLSTIVSERGQGGLAEEEVVEWSVQICDVLDYLHSRNPQVIYRDMKPSNIMIRDSDNKAILIDFGIARTLQTTEDISITKTAIGTVGYMSPEQYRGKPEPRSDIYSLGATMYHLLTGAPPIPFSIPNLSKYRQDISERVAAVVMTCVKIKVEERFKSALEMKHALMGLVKIDKSSQYLTRKMKGPSGPRQHDDPYTELDVKKIISMSKGSKDKKIVPHLINILVSDPHDENRRNAASALGELGDDRTIEPLIMSLSQEDEYVRVNAAWALGRLGDLRAIEPLFQLYENDPSKTVKNSLQKSLINLASKRHGSEVARFLVGLIEENIDGYRDILPDNKDLYFPSIKELVIEFLKDPDRLKVRFHLGLLYLYTGAFNDAIIHFEKAYKLDKKQIDVILFIGRVYEDKGELNNTIKTYEDALKSSPSSNILQDVFISSCYKLAQDYSRKEMLSEEVDCYNKIIKILPEHQETPFMQGNLSLKQKNSKKAIKYFTEYIEKNPQGNYAIEASQLLEALQGNNLLKFISRLWGREG